MCGLLGIISSSPLTEKEKEAFELGMLFTNFKRGPDSTGIVKMEGPNLDVNVVKGLGIITNVINRDILVEVNEPFFDKGKGLVKGKVYSLLGHGRKATQGNVDLSTAHPFTFGDVVGAHNGTIPLFKMKEFSGHSDTQLDIDSKILINEINEKNCDIPAVYEMIEGAAAVWCVNKKTKNIYLFRNSERSLFLIKHKKQNKWVFTSELWIAELAFDRLGIGNDWAWPEKEADASVGASKLLTFSYSQSNKVTLTTEVMKEKPKTFFPADYTSYQGGVTNGAGFSTANSKTKKKITKTEEIAVIGTQNPIPGRLQPALLRTVTTPNEGFIKANPYAFVWDHSLDMFVVMDTKTHLVYPELHQESIRGVEVDSAYCSSIEVSPLSPRVRWFSIPDTYKVSIPVPRLEKKDWIVCYLNRKGDNGFGEFQAMRLSKVKGQKVGPIHFNFRDNPHLTKYLVKEPSKPYTYYLTTEIFVQGEEKKPFDISNFVTYSIINKMPSEEEPNTSTHYTYMGVPLTYKEMKEVVEEVGKCPTCGALPKESEWKDLEFSDWETPICFCRNQNKQAMVY